MANNEFNTGTSILVQQGGVDTSDTTSIIGFQQEITYIQGKGHILPSGLYDGQVKTIIKKDNPITFPLASGSFLIPTANVISIMQDVFGDYYIAGTFVSASLGNLANANYVAMYRPSTNTWTALGTGMNNSALKFIESPSKATLYCVGSFTLAGGVANTSCIAKWNRTLLQWEAVGTGCNNEVDDIAFQTETTFYLTGAFTLAGGVANTIRIAYWNGANYVAMGTGLSSGQGYALKFDSTLNTLYVSGTFGNANAVANTNGIAIWTHSTSTWTALGGAGANAFVGTPYDIALDTERNRLYVVGNITSVNGDASLQRAVYFDLTANTWNRWGQGLQSGTGRRILKVGSNWIATFGSANAFLQPSSSAVAISSFYSIITGIAVWNAVADIWVPYNAFNTANAIAVGMSVSTDGLQILTGGLNNAYMTVFNINSLSYVIGSFIVPQTTFNNLMGISYLNNKYKAVNLHLQGNYVRLRWSSTLNAWIIENTMTNGQLCYEIPSTTNV